MSDTTEISQAARKASWAETRNERRRQQYSDDPDYRAKQRKARRDGYQRKTQETPNCTANLSLVDSSGALFAVRFGASPYVIGRVFTQSDLAKLLNRQPQVFYRWHQRSIFPDPVLTDDKGNFYYADAEVRQFIRIMGEHQQQTPHYRVDHDDVRARLFEASFHKNPAAATAWVRKHQ